MKTLTNLQHAPHHLLLLTVLGAFHTWAHTGTAAPAQIVRGQDRFELTYRTILPEIQAPGRLWIPMARSDTFQTVEVTQLTTPAPWQLLQDTAHANTILTMETGPTLSGQTVEIRYKVLRKEKAAYIDAQTDPGKHLLPERLVPRNQTFDQIAREATKDHDSDLEQGRALYRHTLDRMQYDKSGQGWGRGDALYACDSKMGNCSDFHAYFIALCRSVGIPARFAIGLTIPADQNAGTIPGYHCWAEFYAGGQWIPVDISEADKAPDLAGYYCGHHPANRFELTAGRDLELNPGPASGAINFLVYPLLEVGGVTVPSKFELEFRRL